MTTLVLIRHGESQANRRSIFAGQIDPDLEERGVQQAELTAKFVSENFKIDKIYSSDLKRAFRTGESLAELTGLEIIPKKELREIDGGLWEGESFDKLNEISPKEYQLWCDNIGEFQGVQGESMEALKCRIMDALTGIATENHGKTIAITTHATPIRVAVTHILHRSLSKMKDIPWATNASVTVLNFENGEWSVVKYSEDSHMDKLRTTLPDNI